MTHLDQLETDENLMEDEPMAAELDEPGVVVLADRDQVVIADSELDPALDEEVIVEHRPDVIHEEAPVLDAAEVDEEIRERDIQDSM